MESQNHPQDAQTVSPYQTATNGGGNGVAVSEAEDAGAYLVTWDGPDDPANPKNYSKSHKWFLTLFAALLCFDVSFGSSVITGDLPGAAESLHVSVEVINLTVTLFVCGFAFGPMIFAPLSELYGRKPIYIVCGGLYFIFILPCALAKNVGTILVCRLISGLAASAPMTNVGGTIADIWDVEERGFPMSLFSSVLFIGPAAGPLIGGFVGETKGWRWIYWILMIFTGACWLATFLTSETYAPALLKAKAKKLRKETKNDKYMTEQEMHRKPIAELVKIALFRPMKLLLVEPILDLFSLYLCLVYSLLYLLFFAFPLVFIPRGFNPGQIGLCFCSLIVGILLAVCYSYFVQERVYAKAAAKRGYNTPEDRLPMMLLGSLTLPAGLFIFAWTSPAHISWVGPMMAGVPMGASFVLLYISANAYLVDCYHDVAASALAAKTLLRSLCGAAVPLFVSQMYNAMHPQWAGSLLAFVAVGMMPIPFYFYRYGRQYRKKSQYAWAEDHKIVASPAVGDSKETV